MKHRLVLVALLLIGCSKSDDGAGTSGGARVASYTRGVEAAHRPDRIGG